MKRPVQIGSAAWAAAGSLSPFDLRNLSSDIDGDAYGLRAILAELTFDITTAVGGGCTGREILEWITNIVLRGTVGVPVQGINAYQLACIQMLEGAFLSAPADIAANLANQRRVVRVIIPYDRPRAPKPDESLPCCQAFKDASLIVTLGAAALNANTTVNSCLVNVIGHVRRQGKVRFPALPHYSAQVGTLQDTLPDGVYDALGIIAPAGGFAAAANLSNIALRAGSEYVIPAIPPGDMLSAYLLDDLMGLGIATQANPAMGGAEDWTNDFASLLMFPLIYQGRVVGGNKQTEMVDSQGSELSVECDGSLAAPVYGMKYYRPNSLANEKRQAETFGADLGSLEVEPEGLGGKTITSGAQAQRPGLRTVPTTVKKVTGPSAGKVKFLVGK